MAEVHQTAASTSEALRAVQYTNFLATQLNLTNSM